MGFGCSQQQIWLQVSNEHLFSYVLYRESGKRKSLPSQISRTGKRQANKKSEQMKASQSDTLRAELRATKHVQRGRGRREGGATYMETKMEKLHGQQWRETHRRRRSSLEPRKNHRLAAKRRLDRRIESTGTKLSTRRMQRYPRIPPTMHGLKLIAHQSYRRSWNRPELRRAILGTVNNERVPAIYIARVWRYFIFFGNNHI